MAEARRLLAANPGLARCGAASFGSLNSPLHLAAAKGHHEMAVLLLENGADVNARNIYGQTALMQACRFGHWEVVQTLLVFRCNVWKLDGLSSRRTALHVAATGGHVKCVRLLLAGGGGDSFFVNKAARGGLTALHAPRGAARPRRLRAPARRPARGPRRADAPLRGGVVVPDDGLHRRREHPAALRRRRRRGQVLPDPCVARSRQNSRQPQRTRWLPADVARTWGCHWLEHVLSPKSHLPVPKLPPSGYLSSPLASVIDLARECGLQLLSSSPSPSEYPDSVVDERGGDACAVCLERPCDVAAEVCGHELCVKCALDLCSVIQSYDAPAGRDRRLHPVPALPRRHRLVQETGSF